MNFKKRVFVLIAALLIAVIAAGTIFHLQAPVIKANNIDLFRNRLSSNAPIKITFNQLMNRDSVEKGFTLFPEMGGKFDWLLNVVTFTPEQRFKVGETYTVTVSGTVENILGKPLGEDMILNFLVTDPPKVSLAVPNEETNVDSKITVMFDRPMTELTTYDVLESREFPMKITPDLPGRFKWIGTSAFQYIPKDRLAYSTEYKVLIPAGTKSLDGGAIEQDYAFTFKTPRIKLTSNTPDSDLITASTPYRLYFNQDVNLESVKEHVKIADKDAKNVDLKLSYEKRREMIDEGGKQIEKEIEDKKIAQILPAIGDWGYDNLYTIEASKGILGAEGNLSAEFEGRWMFRTSAFLLSKHPEDKATDANPFGDITLNFDQEIALEQARANFSLKPSVDLDVAYLKICDPKFEPEKSPDEQCPLIDDTKTVVFTAKQKMQNNAEYSGRLDKNLTAKNGLKYLKNDIEWKFTTADVFKVLRASGTGKYKDGVSCIFTSNLANYENLKDQIIFSPGVKGINVESYTVDLTLKSDSRYGCDLKNRREKFVIAISAYLNPSAKHTVTLKGSTKDIFNQTLGADFTFDFTTQPLLDEDVELDLVQKNFFGFTTLDQHAAPVFTATNLDEFDFEICKMEAKQALSINTEFDRATGQNRRHEDYSWNVFAPSNENCSEYKSIKKKLEKGYWRKEYIEVDLAADLDHQLQPGYYYLRASSPKAYHIKKIYSSGYPSGEKKIMKRPDMLLAVTNMHAALKKSHDAALFWVTDLSQGKPLTAAKISLYNYKGEPIPGESATDSMGVAKRELHDLPFAYAVVSKDKEEIFVDANWTQGIAPWDYQMNYSELERFTQGYVYTDRPLYKPTHDVFFKGILRYDDDAALSMPKENVISVSIADSRGANVYLKNHPISRQGSFAGILKLDEKAPLGRYYIEACFKRFKDGYCEWPSFSNSFYVEEYRKPEYKFEAEFSKESYLDKQEMKVLLNAQYFFGAPVVKGKVSWTIRAQNYYFDEHKGEWYSFTDSETFRKCYFGCPFEDQFLAEGSGETDSYGRFSVTHKIDLSSKDAEGNIKAPDSSKLYTLSATVQDKNNQTVAVNKSAIIHRGEFYVGVKNESYLVKAGGEMPIKVITVDPKGLPVSGKEVKLQLNKLDWKYVKKKNVDSGFYWDNELEEKLIKEKNVTSDEDGKAKYAFDIDKGGEYVVRAVAADSLGNTFGSSVDFYATTSDFVSWKHENNNRMDLKLDKLAYEVGDTAKVLVKSPYKDVKALVTYERGDIMEHKLVDITSNAHVIEVPITDKMLPNFYVSVMEIKGGNKQDPPDFKMGYANLIVDSTKRELKISVKTDKKFYKPGDKVNMGITTTDKDSRPIPADLSIAVVDESLLALKGNEKRDLLNVFYGNKFLGVLTADTMAYFLERINVSDIKGVKGGSGKGLAEFGKARGEFEDTAFWRNSLETNADGTLNISFTLPDNLTTWNIEVIGATQDSKFGSVNETITTQKAVMLRPVLPRFALFGDKLRLGAIVHNFTGQDAEFSVSIEAKNLNVADEKIKKARIKAEGSEKVLWETIVPKVKSGTDIEITLSADTESGEDAVYQKFPIYSYSTPETQALSSFTNDASYIEKVFLPESIDPEFGELKIVTGATLATYVSDSLNYLFGFPYGCTEQLISRVIVNVVMKNSVSLPNLKDKIKLAPIYDEKGKEVDFDTVVSTTLQRLYKFQRKDGGFGYFEESRESYPYLTAYIVFGFDQMKKAGYAVDADVANRAVDYLTDYMRSNRDLKDPHTGKLREKDSYYANSRAYMLFVLAEIGAGDAGLTNNLYENRKLLSSAGKTYLAMTLRSVSQNSESKIQKLIQDLENQARIESRGTYMRNDEASGITMMTNTKTTALAAQALNRLAPDHPLLSKLVNWLIKVRKDGRWDTTQDNVAALTALFEYLEKNKETDAQYAAKIALNNKIVEKYEVTSKNILDSQELVRQISDLKIGGDGNIVAFNKDGTGRLYYDMVLRYFLPIEEIAARSEGFVIERNYYKLDDKKLERPLTKAEAGETLRGHLTIVVPEERHFVSIENFLPAGFELVNFEFETADQSLQSNSGDEIKSAEAPYSAPAYYEGRCVECGDNGSYRPTFWSHKELRDDRMFLFAESMGKGVYEYDYYVNVTSEGGFHHPPATISEMYFPENFGRTGGAWMKVE